MPNVRRPIDPSEFSAIPRMREVIKTLPEQLRICPEHGEEATIREGSSSQNAIGVAPFKEANWVGCCEDAIDRVVEAVRNKTLEFIDRAKRTYVEELAGELEPEHTGEIVAIELGTGDYFVGEDEIDAADKARAAGHLGMLYFLRVGSPYAHRVMSPRQ